MDESRLARVVKLVIMAPSQEPTSNFPGDRPHGPTPQRPATSGDELAVADAFSAAHARLDLVWSCVLLLLSVRGGIRVSLVLPVS